MDRMKHVMKTKQEDNNPITLVLPARATLQRPSAAIHPETMPTRPLNCGAPTSPRITTFLSTRTCAQGGRLSC